MKVAIMHCDQPILNWYTEILKKCTYGGLSRQGIDYELFFHGEKLPDPENNNFDLIDFSEWCNPWHKEVVSTYSTPMICTTAETSNSALSEYLARNNINIDFMLSRISHFIARSSWTKEMLSGRGIDSNKISVIHYGSDLNLFKPDVEPDEPAFLYVGSINYRKGIQYLIPAYLKIMDKTNWKLKLIVGEFNNDPKLLEYINYLAGKYDKIQVMPFPPIPELPKFYHEATCYCFIQDYGCPAQCSSPSIWAYSCGLPIISLDFGVLRDYVKNGENGFLCKSVEEIPQRMLEITHSDWQKMGKVSRTIAEDNHSPEKIAAKYKDVYDSVLKRLR